MQWGVLRKIGNAQQDVACGLFKLWMGEDLYYAMHYIKQVIVFGKNNQKITEQQGLFLPCALGSFILRHVLKCIVLICCIWFIQSIIVDRTLNTFPSTWGKIKQNTNTWPLWLEIRWSGWPLPTVVSALSQTIFWCFILSGVSLLLLFSASRFKQSSQVYLSNKDVTKQL